ncbi:MAG: hypothetical protein QNL04_15215 [SAR324 cluster bacterium]|nr:hypothetical protein [SAR324 cluster bacterium]
MSDLLKKMGIEIPEQDQPEWAKALVNLLEEKEEEINSLTQKVAELTAKIPAELKTKEPLPALEVPDGPQNAASSGPASKGQTYEELELPEDPETQPETTTEKWKADDDDSIFEDPEEEGEEEEEAFDPRYLVTIDSDLEYLIPEFYKLRYQEIKDYQLMISMGTFEEIEAVALASRGAAITFGFEYLGKLLYAFGLSSREPIKKKLEKILFEISFYMDQVRITYG